MKFLNRLFTLLFVSLVIFSSHLLAMSKQEVDPNESDKITRIVTGIKAGYGNQYLSDAIHDNLISISSLSEYYFSRCENEDFLKEYFYAFSLLVVHHHMFSNSKLEEKNFPGLMQRLPDYPENSDDATYEISQEFWLVLLSDFPFTKFFPKVSPKGNLENSSKLASPIPTRRPQKNDADLIEEYFKRRSAPSPSSADKKSHLSNATLENEDEASSEEIENKKNNLFVITPLRSSPSPRETL